jgi:hypothetical protein
MMKKTLNKFIKKISQEHQTRRFPRDEEFRRLINIAVDIIALEPVSSYNMTYNRLLIQIQTN